MGSSLFQTRSLSVGVIGLFIFVSMSVPAFGGEWPDSSDHPIHGEMTREDFEYSKRLFPEKDGALGDAAAGSDRYDMLRHALDLKIDPLTRWIGGSVTFEFASLVEDMQIMVLDLTANLTADSVTSSAGTLVFSHDADSLLVTLPETLAIGQEGSIQVYYSGYPVEPVESRGLMFRTHRGTPENPALVDIVASMSEPAFAKYWWPCKDKPADKALSEVRITVPDGLIGISNGTLVSEGPATEPGWNTNVWQEDYPIASYLVSVAVSDYLSINSVCETTLGVELSYDIPLKNWVFPWHFEVAQVAFTPLCEMMEEFEGFFGPYPFRGEKYGHAEFIWGGAMEHQTVTSIGTGAIVDTGSHDWLIVHELAHQWFGDHLTPLNWRDIWLNEGFASYSESLWEESLWPAGSEEGLNAYLADLEDDRSEKIWANEGPVYDPIPVFPGKVIYDKGAWILHMLRGRMGDGPFFDLLGQWGRQGGSDSAQVGIPPMVGYSVTTEEFIALANDFHSGEDLTNFFWPYLEETVLPEIAFEFSILEGTGGPGTKLEVALRQIQVPLFDNVFPIEVLTEDGLEVVKMRLDEDLSRQEYEFSSPVLEVDLDPDHWVLWKLASGISTVQGISLAFPNPSDGSILNLRYYLEESSHVVFRVFDVMGREVFWQDLGFVEDEPGFIEFSWDQKTNNGIRLASGIYWATLEVAGSRYVKKFTVLH